MLADLEFTTIALDHSGIEVKLKSFDDYRRETGTFYKKQRRISGRIETAINAACAKS